MWKRGRIKGKILCKELTGQPAYKSYFIMLLEGSMAMPIWTKMRR